MKPCPHGWICWFVFNLGWGLLPWPLPADEPDSTSNNQSPSASVNPFDLATGTSKLIAGYEQHVKRHPEDHETLTLLGTLYLRQGHEMDDPASYRRAEQVIERALELNPDSLSAVYCKALLLSSNHQFQESLRLAQTTYKAHPEAHQFLLLIGDVLLELGNLPEATATYQRVAELSPRVYLDSRQSRLAENRGELKSAIQWMHHAAEGEMFQVVSKEGRAWYDMRLGELYFAVGNLDKAERHLADALRSHPDYPPALGAMAKVRVSQGKLEEAEALYRKGIAINNKPELLVGLGDLYMSIGKRDLAQQCYSDFEKLALANPAHAHHLAMFWANQSRNLERAHQLASNDLDARKSVHAYDALAWVLYKQGKFSEAAETMDLALQTGFQEAELLFHAGMIQIRMGDRDRAKELLQQSLDLNPYFSVSDAEEARRIVSELNAQQ